MQPMAPRTARSSARSGCTNAPTHQARAVKATASGNDAGIGPRWSATAALAVVIGSLIYGWLSGH